MFIDSNGAYAAETPEEMLKLFQMATGQVRDPNLSRDNGMSPLEMIGVLGATYPGTSGLFGSNPIDIQLDPYRYSAGQPGLTSMPDGPSGAGSNLRGKLKPKKGLLSSALGAVETTPKTRVAQSKAIGSGVTKLQQLLGYTDETAKLGGRMATAALAKNPLLRAGMKFGGPLAAGLAVGDILLGDESFGNKAMDAGMMVAGGALGSVVPVVGTTIGASLGKAASDAIQFIGGGGKSAEERKLEEALALLQGGRV